LLPGRTTIILCVPRLSAALPQHVPLFFARSSHGQEIRFMTGLIRAAITLSALAIALPGSTAQTESVFTDLDPRRCRVIDYNRQTGESLRRCRGAAGYRLLVADADLRVSVTVVAPDRRRYPLNYADVVTPALTTLGEKAEWRLEGKGRRRAAIALIVPVNAHDESEFPHRVRSYLAVAKIGGDTICVTDRIRPSGTAVEEARRAADSAARRSCLVEPATTPPMEAAADRSLSPIQPLPSSSSGSP
jgi:hypothetical protein